MKKLLLVLAVAFTVGVNSQTTYGYYNAKSKEIDLSVNDKGNVYMSLDTDGQVGLTMGSKQREGLIELLTTSYDKFKSWSKTAKDNNVNKINKDIDSKNISGYFYYGDKWRFGAARLRTIFYVEKGIPSFYLYCGKITASSNKYMKSDPQMLNLSNREDLDSLLDMLKSEVINNFIKNKENKEVLFN